MKLIVVYLALTMSILSLKAHSYNSSITVALTEVVKAHEGGVRLNLVEIGVEGRPEHFKEIMNYQPSKGRFKLGQKVVLWCEDDPRTGLNFYSIPLDSEQKFHAESPFYKEMTWPQFIKAVASMMTE